MTEQVTTGRNRSRLAGGGHLPAKVADGRTGLLLLHV